MGNQISGSYLLPIAPHKHGEGGERARLAGGVVGAGGGGRGGGAASAPVHRLQGRHAGRPLPAHHRAVQEQAARTREHRAVAAALVLRGQAAGRPSPSGGGAGDARLRGAGHRQRRPAAAQLVPHTAVAPALVLRGQAAGRPAARGGGARDARLRGAGHRQRRPAAAQLVPHTGCLSTGAERSSGAERGGNAAWSSGLCLSIDAELAEQSEKVMRSGAADCFSIRGTRPCHLSCVRRAIGLVLREMSLVADMLSKKLTPLRFLRPASPLLFLALRPRSASRFCMIFFKLVSNSLSTEEERGFYEILLVDFNLAHRSATSFRSSGQTA